jgi:outer membrane receptor for ferrienterochelin and colicins
MRHVISILVLVAQASLALAGQSSQVFGVVRDSMGLPMPGVEVTLTGPATTTTVTTADNGTYRFDVMESGAFRLSARKVAFREWVREVAVEPGSSVDLGVVLEPGYAETVIVTASRGPESLISAPASVAVVGGREIEASPAENVADLLRGVPGLNIVQFGARDINVNTRSSTGVLANSMLAMVDGRAFDQPFYGAVYWDLMTMTKDEIAQIEILRTPASALWGAHALGGVINIRTKSPRQVEGLRGQIGFGERGTKSASATWADSTDRLSYKLSGSYFEQAPWERDNVLPDGSPMPPAVIFQNRGTKQPKFDARVDWDADPKSVWSVRGGVAGANGLVHSALGPGEFASGSYASYLEVDHHSDELDVKAYWNRLDAPFRIVLFGLDEDSTNDTYAFEALRRFSVGASHRFTFGGSVRVDQFSVTIAPDDRRRVDAGVFLEDKLRLSDTVNLVLGGRFDKYDTTSTVFAPRLGVVVSPTPTHSFRLAYNRAYRAPSLLENFVRVAIPAVVPLDPPFFYQQLVVGSTNLKMEKQDAVEIGYTGVLNERTTVFATVYDQRITNNIWFLPVSFYGPGAPPAGWPGDPTTVPLLASVFGFVNIGEVRDRGVELTTTVEWPKVLLQGSYTFQDTPRLGKTEFPLQINQPAKHHGGGSLSYSAGQWSVAGDVHFTDRAFWADVFTEPFWGYTDSYLNVNARMSYRLRAAPWELWMSATDLFDQKIKSHVYGDIVRRKVTAGVRWQWKP